MKFIKLCIFLLLSIIVIDSYRLFNDNGRANKFYHRVNLHSLRNYNKNQDKYNNIYIKNVIREKSINNIFQNIVKRSFIFVNLFIILSSQVVSAQIPSMDDYLTGSGTKIQKTINTNNNDELLNTLRNTNSLITKINLLPDISKQMKEYIENEKYDSIIQLLKYLKEFKLSYYGYDNEQKLSNILEISDKSCEEIESLRSELYYIFGQIQEISMKNNIYYFNKDDLVLTQVLIDENEKSLDATNNNNYNNKEELLILVKDSNQIIEQIIKLVH